ncbi:MAG: polysaccharide biosynthesis protein [Candidatus Omnitrophica bacterium]|nr:polysaccharide biosynthesis protein [Candidatus Omnitrophota bacterium]
MENQELSRYRGKRILITGGTGSWGTELISHILPHQPAEIRIYSRGEAQQVISKRRFENHPALRYVVGDVRDKTRLDLAMHGMDIVFHLAALKHVPVCEENPWETVMTNVIGTQNVINAAIHCHVEKVIYVASDKGVDPLNLYGVTKLTSEKLIVAANNMAPTVFSCYRAGNVIGTSGSVIPLFREQILRLGEVTITDPNMTRFFIPLRMAIASLIHAESQAVGGETFVLKMKSIRISDLAELMSRELSPKKRVTVKQIGIRPGEKLHELLISRNEAARAIDIGEFYVIMPLVDIPKLNERYENEPRGIPGEYSSENAKLFTQEDFTELLRAEGWLDPDHPSPYLSRLSEEQLRHIYAANKWLGLS